MTFNPGIQSQACLDRDTTTIVYAAKLFDRSADNDRLLSCRSGVNTLRGNKTLLRLLTSIYDRIIGGPGLSMCAW